MKKLISLLLIAALLTGMAACGTAPAPAETETDAPETAEQVLTADYQRRYAADYTKAWKTDARMSADDTSGAVTFTASKGTEIVLETSFLFDTLPVSRFSFGAAADEGAEITLAFYLDKEETPFAEETLSPLKSESETAGMLAKGLQFKNRSVDISALALTGEHSLRIVVAEAPENANFTLCYVEFAASTVPTVYLDIDESQGTIAEMNASEDHSAKCHGEMRLQIPAGYTAEYTDEIQESATYALDYVRGRGNSTWQYSKKPYKIKLESGADLLGMGKAKEWALIANYCDNSLLRNKITYWLGEQCGLQYTPQSEPVEVVLGGEYIGSYMLSETVQVKDSRLAIDDLEDTPDASDAETVSGGYLISLSAREADDEGQASFRTDNFRFFMESPSFEDGINEAQMAYITQYVSEVENAIFGGTWEATDGTPVEELLDFHSAAIYYLLQSFSGNSDAFITDSTFLYKPRGDKLYFGPLWDFDYTTWGETSYAGWETYGYVSIGSDADYGEYDNLVAVSGSCDESLWINALFENETFLQVFEAAWEELKAAMTQLTAEGGQYDIYCNRLQTTAFYNFEALGASQITMIDPNGCFEGDTITLTWEQEAARLKDWLIKMLPSCEETVKLHIPTPVELKVIDSTDGSELSCLDALLYEPLPDLPEAPEKEGYIFLGYLACMQMSYADAVSGGYLDEGSLTEAEIAAYQAEGCLIERDVSRVSIVEDGMYLKANYISLEDYIPVTAIRFVRDSYSEPIYGYDEDLRIVVEPENATLWTMGKIVYGSSDEDVVYAMGDGSFGCGTPGQATVTAQADGLTATAEVTVADTDTP